MMNKIEIKKDILDKINKVTYVPSSFDDLVNLLKINEDDYNEFSKILDEMLISYDIFLNKKKDKYLSSRLANKYKGVMSIRNEDYGFISNEFYPDFYCNSVDFGDAMDKDIVLYSIIDSMGYGRSSQAVVLEVVKRYYEYLVGEVYYKQGKYFLDSNEKYLKNTILISNPGKAKSKDIVRTKIIKYGNLLKVDVVEVLGDNKTIGIDIAQVLAQYGIQKEFPMIVEEETNLLSPDMDKEKKRRVSYSDKIIFTIDGDDAKDLDDAVSLELLPNGNYLIGVYIADVTYYVKEGSKLDEEAYNRGTSIYLTDRVIPMLPVKLSNDLCSLNPNEEKLVMTCIMEVDKNGNVCDCKIEEGIIKTCKRLTYSKCNDVLKHGLENNPDYDIVYDSLKLMSKLAKILENKRIKRGSINFDIDEAKIIVDEEGHPIDIVKRVRDVSEKIIEEFMILANESVSEFITRLELPFIYRVHDKPDNIKFQMLKTVCQQLGYKVLGLYPKEIQKLMNSLNSKDEYLKTTILRLMAKAEYSEENIGHFGLASQCYTHFTSPIRRYPDDICHRLIRKYLFSDNKVFEQLDSNKSEELRIHIGIQAKHCSDCERIANDIEFKVIDMKKAEYMASYIGDIFEAKVCSVLKFGIFVALDNTVEGLISSRLLQDKNFDFDEYNKTYYHRFNGRKISLGDTLKVKLIKSNKKIGEIDFDLVYNNNGGARTYGKSKGYYSHKK